MATTTYLQNQNPAIVVQSYRAVDAQCFAALIINRYIERNIKDQEAVLDLLHSNKELLDRVAPKMSTCTTKE